MNLQLRTATTQDLPAIRCLWQHLTEFHTTLGLAFSGGEKAALAWQASFERTLGRFSFLWVAELEANVEGFLLARVKHTPAYLGSALVGEISDLWVEPVLRRQGAAAGLVQRAMQEFHNLSVHSVEVQIMAANQEGLAFWQKQGFTPELIQVRHCFSKETERQHA